MATRNSFSPNPVHVADANEQLPASVDWVAEGKVTPVKNQGMCGSCWSFSTTGSVEGALAIATGKLTSLSEEDLVQCNNVTDSGCNGGLMDNAFKWIEKNGIASESSYPYSSGTGITGICTASKATAKITGFTDVASNDEDALKSAVAKGPVSIAIEADKGAFQHYKSGVLNSPFCGKQLDHGVLIVGYGEYDGLFGKQQYWKVKNSWGPSWGESGYIRMHMGNNMCGLATQPSFPTGASYAD
jgi:C1A family cysteine protease